MKNNETEKKKFQKRKKKKKEDERGRSRRREEKRERGARLEGERVRKVVKVKVVFSSLCAVFQCAASSFISKFVVFVMT